PDQRRHRQVKKRRRPDYERQPYGLNNKTSQGLVMFPVFAAAAVLQSAAALDELAALFKVKQHRIEDAVDEAPALVGAVELGHLDRLVDGNLGRDIEEIEKFADRHAQHNAVDD